MFQQTNLEPHYLRVHKLLMIFFFKFFFLFYGEKVPTKHHLIT